MADVLLVVAVVGLQLAINAYLRRIFANTHPEYLPFLNGMRWSVIIFGTLAGIGTVLVWAGSFLQ